jgi:hypothetical protein
MYHHHVLQFWILVVIVAGILALILRRKGGK